MLNTRNEYVRAEFIKGFNFLIDSFESNNSATFEVKKTKLFGSYCLYAV
jgi:hypothetical protein